MKIILFLVTIMLSFSASAQRIDTRNGMVYKDGQPYALVNRDNCGFSGKCRATISATDGRILAMIDFEGVNYGGHTYAVINFLKSDLKARVEDLPSKEWKLAKFIVKNNLLSGSELNEASVAELVKKYPN